MGPLGQPPEPHAKFPWSRNVKDTIWHFERYKKIHKMRA